jgi:hypothetical protein
MEKGSLAAILGDTVIYTRPVDINDQRGAIQHHAGFVRKGERCLVLSDPGDWMATPDLGFSGPWTQILLGGQVVWVKRYYVGPLVQTEDSVVY